MNESGPRIMVATGLGQWFSDVDINTERLTAYAASQGIDSNTVEVRIKAEDTLHETASGELRTINGLYHAKSGVIALYLCRVTYDYQRIYDAIESHAHPDEVRQQFSVYWSKQYSRILNHELTHKKFHTARGEEGQQPYPDLAAFELARIAMLQTQYANDPEEAECNNQAASGPDDIVQIRIRDLPK